MRSVYSKVFTRELISFFDESFSVEEKGIYLIHVTASAKSWWQNTKTNRSFWQKDSLTLRIDKQEIFSVFKKKRLRSTDIWNGNILKGHELAAYALFLLDKGDHTLSFDVLGKPYLGEVSVSLIDGSDIRLENLVCSSRDRIPWLVFLFHRNIALKEVSITARAKKYSQRNDDDLQIRIDDVIEKNPAKLAHRDWHWCGKILKGSSKTFTRNISHGQSPKRIELNGDGEPYIEEIMLKIVDGGYRKALEKNTGYVTWEHITLRGQPHTASDTIFVLREGRNFEIIERAIRGERPKNESGISLGSDRWHKIRVEEKEGYVFSQGVELEGEDPQTIQNIILERARVFEVDPCLIVAIAEQESRLFPYAVSQNKAQGIFQLKTEAFHDVNRIYEKQFTDRFSLLENIDAGILYYKHLRDQYAAFDHSIQRSLAAWNWGMGNIPKTRAFSLSPLPRETQDFIQAVLQKRKQCDRRSGNPVLRTALITGILLFMISFIGFSARSENVLNYAAASFIRQSLTERDILHIIEERIVDFDGDGREEHFYLARLRTPLTSYTILYQKDDGPLRAFPHRDDGILAWSIGDVNQNNKPDAFIHFGYSGSAGFGTLALYEWDAARNTFKKIFWRSEINSTFGFRNVEPSTDTDELVYFYSKRKWENRDHQAIYRWSSHDNSYELLRDE